jgi:AcrR family transcriptional regulator
MTAAGTRARVRAELTREIAEVARRHLGSAGAAALSLRAVARELGMASSAVYRYFPSRDDLLTALIVDAYDALGDAAEQAERAAPRDDLRGRWLATCRAVREWAVAHPHEYALVYGSPVPGYAAPEATIAPAARVGLVLGRVIADGLAAGTVVAPDGSGGDVLTPGVADALSLPPALAARAIMIWSSLYGAISFELFGQTNNVVEDKAAFFDGVVERLGDQVGLPVSRG